MPWMLPAAVGAGAALQYMGGQQAGGAAEDAAKQAAQASREALAYQKIQNSRAIDAYDQYTPMQFAALDKSIASQEYNVKRQEKLVASIDPALIEAGKQTMQLLQGQAAPVLDNLKAQRQTQRQGIMDSLREQLGPGAESSSLGLKTLQQFDAETANTLSQAQQQYLGQVSGLALNGANTLGASLGQVNQGLASLGAQYGQIGLNRASIYQGGAAGAAGAYQNIINTAGANTLGSLYQGQALSGIGSSIARMGGSLAANYGSPAGGADKPIVDYSGGGNPPAGVKQAPVGNY